MAKILDSIYKMRFLDEIADKKTFIHNIHPVAKLSVTIFYIIIVISYEKYDLSGLLPLVFYPIIIFALAEIPVMPMIKRMLIVAPFVIGIGIFNPIFDREIITEISGISFTGGWVSFLSLLFKYTLTVLASLLLIATTGMDNIAYGLRKFKIPKIFVMQLLLTYRYISVLMEEISRIWNAYTLRDPSKKGVSFKAWGSLLGQLLLRTYDRAQRVYEAMILRGFNGEFNTGVFKKFSTKDIKYVFLWIVFFVIARIINIPSLLGLILTGVVR